MCHPQTSMSIIIPQVWISKKKTTHIQWNNIEVHFIYIYSLLRWQTSICIALDMQILAAVEPTHSRNQDSRCTTVGKLCFFIIASGIKISLAANINYCFLIWTLKKNDDLHVVQLSSTNCLPLQHHVLISPSLLALLQLLLALVWCSIKHSSLECPLCLQQLQKRTFFFSYALYPFSTTCSYSFATHSCLTIFVLSLELVLETLLGFFSMFFITVNLAFQQASSRMQLQRQNAGYGQ